MTKKSPLPISEILANYPTPFALAIPSPQLGRREYGSEKEPRFYHTIVPYFKYVIDHNISMLMNNNPN